MAEDQEISESVEENSTQTRQKGDGHCVEEYRRLKLEAEKLSVECPKYTYQIDKTVKMSASEKAILKKKESMKEKRRAIQKKCIGPTSVKAIRVSYSKRRLNFTETESIESNDKTTPFTIYFDVDGYIRIEEDPYFSIALGFFPKKVKVVFDNNKSHTFNL